MSDLTTIQNFRVRYLVGLTAIALLVTASFITMQRVVSEQRDYAGVITLAGHQAGLANRIAYFASLMAATEDETEFQQARNQVGRTIEQMRAAHHALVNGEPKKSIPRISNARLRSLYDHPLTGLDRAMGRFLDRAGQVYNQPMATLHTESAAYLFLTTYGPNVLEPRLEIAVAEYERIARQAILQIERLEFLLWVAVMVTLALELAFIFRPLERRVENHLTSLQRSVAELTHTRRRLLAAQKMSLLGDWELDVATQEMSWSKQVYEICGIPEKSGSFSIKAGLARIHPQDRTLVETKISSLVKGGDPVEMEFRVIRPGGEERLVFQRALGLGQDKMQGDEGQVDKGPVDKIAGTVQDITERRELSVRLEKLSGHIPGFIFEFHRDGEGRGRFSYASAGIEDTCSIQAKSLENDAIPLLDLVHEKDKDRVIGNIRASVKELGTWKEEFRIHHPDKGVVWLEGHATGENCADGSSLWYGYIWDITERKQSETQIRKLALYDPLTGLANRRLIMDRMAHAISSAGRHGNYGAVLMLDLDNFKNLNDTRGHDVGDALLTEAAARLLSCVRENDTVGRLGGDEFVVILELLGQAEDRARTSAMGVAEKIRRALTRTYILEEGRHSHHSSVSVGVALFHSDGAKGSEILKQADVAMYEAKDQGRNRTCFYTAARQALVNNTTAMVDDIKAALDNREFGLVFQPQVMGSGRVCGAEVLLRWQPPGRPPVMPGAFIGLAEESGLIRPLGQWVLDKACRDLKLLNRALGHEKFHLSVNISAKQFMDESFPQKVEETLVQTGINSSQVNLEVTETCLVQDMEMGAAILSELRAMGLGIELDDFGTGYSSLHAINELPLTALKLDRSLVQGIENGQGGGDIVRAALAMSKAMSLDTVAEGVETRSQEAFLIREGCEIFQGFLYARPMPFEALVSFLEHQVSAPAELNRERQKMETV